jgi:hypothetical protein
VIENIFCGNTIDEKIYWYLMHKFITLLDRMSFIVNFGKNWFARILNHSALRVVFLESMELLHVEMRESRTCL